MKKILMVLLIIGMVAISGCVAETDQETGQVQEQTQEPAQQEQQIQQPDQPTVQYDPLTSSEITTITDKIEDLDRDYNVIEFTSTDSLTSVTIEVMSSYKETDVVRTFKYMRSDSDTAEYEVKIKKTMSLGNDDSDDVICSYRDTADMIDYFSSKTWYDWQEEIAYNTCSVL